MIKKAMIAGLAVVVGVCVLAFVSPPLFDWMRHETRHMQQKLEDAVPPEQRIEILKDKLKDLEHNKSHYFDAVAKEAVQVDQLAAEVNKMSDSLALQWKKIELMRDGLETQKASIRFDNGNEYKRGQVETQLASDFSSYQVAEKAVEAKKELLSARKQALDAAKQQLATLESRRDEMNARLVKMEADLKLVRMREATSALKLDDNEYSSLASEMDAVSGKIAERQKALDLQAEFTNGPVDPLSAKPVTRDNILKQIDDYKAGRKADAKNVAEEPGVPLAPEK